MQMIDVQVESSGVDSWGNKIKPYIINIPITIEWTPELAIGTNILKNIKTKQIQTVTKLLNRYEKSFQCDECHDWGCTACCSSTAEIRNRQGTFS